MQSFVDSINRVILHSQKETAAHLWPWSSSVEQSWGCVSVPLLTDALVSCNGGVEIPLVDTDGNSHNHVLWSLCNLALNFEQVGLL